MFEYSPKVDYRRSVGRIGVLIFCLVCATPAAAQTNAESDSSEVREDPSATQNPTSVSRPKRVRSAVAKESRHRPTAALSVDHGPATLDAGASELGDAGPNTPGAPTDAGPEPAGAASTLEPTAGDVPAIASAIASTTSTSIAAEPSSSSLPGQPSNLAAATSTPVEYAIAEVKIRDSIILKLKLSDGGLTPKERAQRATRAIESALVETQLEPVRTELRQDRALLLVGRRPIVELTRADAEAVGEGSLELFAASAAARVTDILENERQRSIVTHGVFNVMVVVALAVAVLYALRALGILARRTRTFVDRNPERIPAIRLRSIEVVGPHVLRSGIVVGLGVAKLLLQVGLIFAWLLFSSSLFEVTRGMTDRLTAMILAPLSGLAARFVAFLPLLLLTTIGVVVLVVLLRFVALFFGGVARRETELSWLRPELAEPTSFLIRIGLVVLSLLVAAPLVTGNVDGSLARVGMLAVVAVGLASTPLAANVVVGLITLYGGRLEIGNEVTIGKHVGVIASIDLVELRLTCPDGRDLRVPHLVTLVCPLTVAVKPMYAARCLVVTAEAGMQQLVELVAANPAIAETTNLSVQKLEGTLTTIELTPTQPNRAVEHAILVEVARGLNAAQIRLVLAEWRSLA